MCEGVVVCERAVCERVVFERVVRQLLCVRVVRELLSVRKLCVKSFVCGRVVCE